MTVDYSARLIFSSFARFAVKVSHRLTESGFIALPPLFDIHNVGIAISDVRNGSQAAPFVNITLTAASGGKADVSQLEISQHPQIRP